MTNLVNIQLDFYKMKYSFQSNIAVVLHEESFSLLRDFRDRSPVYTGTYRSNWQILRGRFKSSAILASVNISNKTSYAQYMEEGAEKGGPPWHYPDKTKRPTGKLIYSNGRVWAGGWSPGHQRTIGGAINPVLVNNNRRLDKLAQSIADSIIRDF